MNYPPRVINNRIKQRTLPALQIEQGVFKVQARSKRRVNLPNLLAGLGCLAIFTITVFVIISTIALPVIDILAREKALVDVIGDINARRPPKTLTELLAENDISIQHKTSFSDTQAVVTISPSVSLSLLLEIISQVPGVFSLQYSQDGFQVFLAGGSL